MTAPDAAGQLAELRRLRIDSDDEHATSEPWTFDGIEVTDPVGCIVADPWNARVGELITKTHNALPGLLDLVAELQAENDRHTAVRSNQVATVQSLAMTAAALERVIRERDAARESERRLREAVVKCAALIYTLADEHLWGQAQENVFAFVDSLAALDQTGQETP